MTDPTPAEALKAGNLVQRLGQWADERDTVGCEPFGDMRTTDLREAISILSRRPAFDAARFGEAVRMRLATQGLSFRKGAPIAGVSRATLNRVARGKMPDIPTYLALSAWLEN